MSGLHRLVCLDDSSVPGNWSANSIHLVRQLVYSSFRPPTLEYKVAHPQSMMEFVVRPVVSGAGPGEFRQSMRLHPPWCTRNSPMTRTSAFTIGGCGRLSTVTRTPKHLYWCLRHQRAGPGVLPWARCGCRGHRGPDPEGGRTLWDSHDTSGSDQRPAHRSWSAFFWYWF